MQLRMWMYDLAREQAPTLEHLMRMADATQEGGYNAWGLYLEHRFAYPSVPWAQGRGVLTPELVQEVIERNPQLEIIPFANLLGHFEGMIYTEEGWKFAEERFVGLQADPTAPGFMALCEGILRDVLDIFPSRIIHIGGDETNQLGKGARSSQVVKKFEEEGIADGKAELYGRHFEPLADIVEKAGRRTGVWGDMFVEHPTALKHLPKDALLFDWQYFQSPLKTAKQFIDAGHDVVLCPTVHIYNSAWVHLPQTERNVRDHVAAARELDAYGVCVTTWEAGLFGNYETYLPLLKGCGEILSAPEPPPLAELEGAYAQESSAPLLAKQYLKESESAETWATLMGVDLPALGGIFGFGQIRSALKCRYLLYSNPFLLWLRHREELCGEIGDKALVILDRAIAFAPDSGYRGLSEFVRIAIEFVRHVEVSHIAYAKGEVGAAAAALVPARAGFEDLHRIARATNLRIGGSLADIERCTACRDHVEKVIARIKRYGDGSLGYLPSYETICHPKFVPHDQGNWWLINRWANE